MACICSCAHRRFSARLFSPRREGSRPPSSFPNPSISRPGGIPLGTPAPQAPSRMASSASSLCSASRTARATASSPHAFAIRPAAASRTTGCFSFIAFSFRSVAAASRGFAPDSRGWLHVRFSGAPASGSLGFPRCRLFSWRAVSTGTDPCFSAVACSQSRTLRGSLPLPCDARRACRFESVQAGAGRSSHSSAVAASFIRHDFQRLLARRSAAQRKALPVSSGADVDPFDNVYFPPRVSTHARLPLRILPRVLRRFTRPRSTARNLRKGASRL